MGVIVGVRRRQYSLVWHMDYGTIGWLYRSGSVSYSATQRAPNDWWGLAGRATQRAPKDWWGLEPDVPHNARLKVSRSINIKSITW